MDLVDVMFGEIVISSSLKRVKYGFDIASQSCNKSFYVS